MITYDQAQQVAEYRNGFGDDPGQDPQGQGNAHPGADGNPVALVHAVRSTENPNVDILEGNVAVDDTRNDDLIQRLA
jgi:hypothetical protein